MNNLWNDEDALAFIKAGRERGESEVQSLRVYTSRLIGVVPDLVLHGGGNTSAKEQLPEGEVMYIKGSGWDLAAIEAAGLPAVYLQPLQAAKTGSKLSDEEMAALLRAELLDAAAPTPSVEALLHAFCPHAFVDHTHSSAVLALANQQNSAQLVQEIYGGRVAHLPYVMPGFELSIAAGGCFDANPDCEGMWLQNHGLFTFGRNAKTSYDRMIEFVSMAEDYLAANGAAIAEAAANDQPEDKTLTAKITAVLQAAGVPFSKGTVLRFITTPDIRAYSSRPDLPELSRRGTVTPDHVIRIKPFPLLLQAQMSEAEIAEAVQAYAQEYQAYFDRHAPFAAEKKVILDALPRLIVVRGLGIYGAGCNEKAAAVAADLGEQTARVVNAAEKIGRFLPISERELFEMEYWSLEQAKLRKPV